LSLSRITVSARHKMSFGFFYIKKKITCAQQKNYLNIYFHNIMIRAKLGRHPGFDFAVGKGKISLRESLIPRNKVLPKAKQRFLEAKLYQRQIKDSWKQSFAFSKTKILGSKVLLKANLCPDNY
jgi:hypothetical protein